MMGKTYVMFLDHAPSGKMEFQWTDEDLISLCIGLNRFENLSDADEDFPPGRKIRITEPVPRWAFKVECYLYKRPCLNGLVRLDYNGIFYGEDIAPLV